MTVDERVAYLEGKVEEHSRGFGELRDSVFQLDLKMERRFETVDGRFDVVDRHFERVDARIDALDQKMGGRFERVEHRLDTLDDKLSRQFLWVLGVQMAVLVAVIGALAAS